QRRVDDADQHEVEQPAPADGIPRQRQLQDQRDRDGGEDRGELHWCVSSTISTMSMCEKSTAGRTAIVQTPARRSARSTRPTGNPRGYTLSCPVVSTRSPTFTSAADGTYSTCSGGSPAPPPTIPPAPLRSK